jgi:AcrR family transcriptional regulator
MSRKAAGKVAWGRRRSSRPNAEDAIDERVGRSKARVLRATSELLIAKGLSGVSVDEIARRSGVAKTTIYRHWRTRSELVIDACSLLSTAQQTPDSGSLAGDVTILLRDLASLLKNATWPVVLPSIVDAAERDPELAAVYRQIQQGHATPYLQVIERGKRRGEVPSARDSATMVAELVGPLFYRRWFSREALDEKFVKRVVRTVVGKH